MHLRLLIVLFLCLIPVFSYAGGIPTAQTHGPQGSSTALTNGDYVSPSTSPLPSAQRYVAYFIEVPPNTPNLTVQIFDADIGDGNGHDRAQANGFTSSCVYTLRNPSGTTVATVTGDDDGPNGSNNNWITMYTTSNPANGHWELRVDMNGGDDVNEFALRAHDGNSGAGGTELNMYMHSYFVGGRNEVNRSFVFYPFITSGCVCDSNDFDYDGSGGSIQFASRTGVFTDTLSGSELSSNEDWDNNVLTGWATDTQSVEHGLWTTTVTINGDPNYITFYTGAFNAANATGDGPPPSNQPEANTFRMYLPTDAGNKPVKPIMSYAYVVASGPNPPVLNQTTTLRITLVIANPTPHNITFSEPSNIVITNVPGGNALYGGSAVASQGNIISQPAINGSGNITWNPGVVTAGSAVQLSYNVRATPTVLGQRIVITGTPANGNGTRATYVDETGNTTQARATYTYGPLCELAITQGAQAPTYAQVRNYSARKNSNGVSLKWSTEFEVDNLGFHVYREENGKKIRLTNEVLAGSALMAGPGVAFLAGHQYSWWDRPETPDAIYWIEDIDLNGRKTMHGPLIPEEDPSMAWHDNNSPRLSDLANRLAQESSTRPYFSIPAAAPSKKSGKRQFKLAADSTVKISVQEPGWYRITQPQLLNAGFDVSSDPRKLQLYAGGMIVPVIVSGEEDGRFDPSDAVEFFGYPQETPYSNTQTYWLASGKKTGKRMKTKSSKRSFPALTNFSYTIERKDRTLYVAGIRNDEEENFFGPLIGTGPVTQVLNVTNLDATFPADAILEVQVQGLTEIADENPDHRISVLFNGSNLGEIAFDDQEKVNATFMVPFALISEGSNEVQLFSQSDSDVSLLDSIRLTYLHTASAEESVMNFKIPARTEMKLTGFSDNAIRFLDLSNPNSPAFLEAEITQEGSGYSGKISNNGPAEKQIFAFSEAAVKQPASIQLNQPSDWHTRKNLQIVILSHADFIQSFETLKAYRETQNFSVGLVNVEDVYDEFSYGNKNPHAIKEFLKSISSKKNKNLKYVIFAGDATFDPKNYLNFGNLDFVPTWVTPVGSLETAIDDWFVDFDDDGFAEIPVGRLPVRNSQEADVVIAKILQYEQTPAGQDWQNEALLVSDNNDVWNFDLSSEQLSSLFNSQITVNQVSLEQTDSGTARAVLIDSLNSGKLLVNYIGHGSVEIWAGEQIFTSDDALQLSNASRLPVVISMNCYNGFFHDLFTESLSEALLRAANGGAMAVWSSSARTVPDDQSSLNQEMIRLLFGDEDFTIGQAALKAKQSIADPDVRRSWILFGDPVSRLIRTNPEDPGPYL